MLKRLYTGLMAAAFSVTAALGCASTGPTFKVPEMPKEPEAQRAFVLENIPVGDPYLVQHGDRMYAIVKTSLDEDSIADSIVVAGNLGEMDKPQAEVAFFDSSAKAGPGTVDVIKYSQTGSIVRNPSKEQREAADYIVGEVMKTAAQHIRLEKEVRLYGDSRKEAYGLDDKSHAKRSLEGELEKILGKKKPVDKKQ
jgi:hypothetical protein